MPVPTTTSSTTFFFTGAPISDDDSFNKAEGTAAVCNDVCTIYWGIRAIHLIVLILIFKKN